MAVVYASYSLRTGETIKGSVVFESTELAVDARIEDSESVAMPNEFYKSSVMSDVFILFVISLLHF